MLTVPVPRLLPATIAVMGGLLAMKSVTLAKEAIVFAARPTGPAVVASAHAATAHDETGNAGGTKQVSAHGAAAASAGAHGAASAPSGAHGPAPATQSTLPDPDAATTGRAAPAAPPPSSISDGERAVLLELRQRRAELDAREVLLATRESVLAAAEQKLATRADELQALQKRLEALESARQQREDASWQGLVKLYETMKPREAAAIFNELSMPVLLQVIDRMRESKAAPILSSMNPDKARELTTELAKLRTRRDQPPDAPSAGAAPNATPPRQS